MSIIRPEIREAAIRYREILIGAGVLLLGLLAVLTSGGILFWLGVAICFVGTALIVTGIQRQRFRRPGDGPGVVQVTEGRIAYFGPLEGGIVDTDGLSRLTLDPNSHPLHWVLDHDGGTPLHIPVTAKGADQLFDAFAKLPGLNVQAMLHRLERPGRNPTIVWQRPVTWLS
ncbi:hypothetical protein [Qingshengfaniella alkalisoli]|uniref:Uncharacterized protein n=1 Tax=Qingshengfaniella alkalisoli TaxID=2599296 RepID=A0A5B8I7T9_9RHOB|nr:hypothetical protein [Qingshengfaniella alkalisoli]QDY69689.1 hypothetical protein FPZ52_08690 [Qingshengfaniella alkalisoli]